MTDRPILFSAPMVRAILDGRKTQTRRVRGLEDVNKSPDAWAERHIGLLGYMAKASVKGRYGVTFKSHSGSIQSGATHICPQLLPYAPGDRLWVREAHALLPRTAYRMSVGSGTIDKREHPTDDYTAAVFREGFDRSGPPRWRPSIHMPRWASRLTLTVTDVRVQRLQEISATDVKAEGALNYPGHPGCGPAINCYGPDCPTDEARSCNKHGCWGIREDFADLWDGLNAKRGYGWDANPWVAAITFEPHQCNIDQMEAA